MQVRYHEGVAIRVGPEPCIVVREDGGEASVGERAGQPLSRESHLSRVPTLLFEWKATRSTRYRKWLTGRRGRRPWHACTLLEREPGDLAPGRAAASGLVRIGKARSRSR